MKKLTIISFLILSFAALVITPSCTKENEEVLLDSKLSTSQVINITSDSATVIGFVVASGDGLTEKGVCYNTTPNPTTANTKVVYTGSATTATFNVVLSGLNYATKYYAKAYVINSAGTIYGEEYEFTTKAILPTVTTAAVTDVSFTTALSGGEVTSDGGAAVSSRGVCYSTDPNPTILNGKTIDGDGLGAFVSNLSGLTHNTTYYLRAYAVNGIGASYGAEVQFTTQEIVITTRTWYIPGDYVAASYPGAGLNDWDPANSPKIMSLETSSDNLEGYVYMANAANNWKMATQPNWDGPNYGVGETGFVSATGDNFNSPAGYYKINVNAATLAYTAIATNWGVIGAATPLGWDDETPLSYDPATKTWRGGLHLTASEFKFRANHDWGFNYGSTAGNATLDAGGSNIPIALEGDYYFTLDLSNPNAYTYTANTWGLIGSATPGGWDSDQNMTWDAFDQSLTVTVDLVVGEIKFRANDGWDINLGGPLNALVPGGDNIPIGEAGNYTIKLFLGGTTPSCTVVKN